MADDMIRDERQFPLGSVTEAEVELEIGSGSLTVASGSGELGDAVFEYSHPELKPEAEFHADGNEARLHVRQPSVRGVNNVRNRWALRFNSQTALELGVESGSGNIALDLDDLNLTHVDIESGSGNIQASLGGRYELLDEVTLDVASGNVEAQLGGEFPALESLGVGSASGRTRIGLTGACPALRRVEVGSASGNIDLDLTGSFARDDLGVRIQAASGNVTVRVPRDIGVSMSSSVISGRISADGFTSEAGRRVNQAFGQSAATIWLNIQVVSGNIDILTD